MSKTLIVKTSASVLVAGAIIFAVLALTLPAGAQEAPEGGDGTRCDKPAHGMMMPKVLEELGITQEEFKENRDDPEFREQIREKMDELHQQKMQQKADELGITLDELREQHLERWAEKLGITVDELREKIENGEMPPKPEFDGKKPNQGLHRGQKPRGDKSNRGLHLGQRFHGNAPQAN